MSNFIEGSHIQAFDDSDDVSFGLCKHCGTYKHISDKCPFNNEKQLQYIPLDKDKSNEPPQSKKSKSTFRKLSEVTCYTCNMIGHYATTCELKKDVTCWKCKQKGHYGTQCLSQKCEKCYQYGHMKEICEEEIALCWKCKNYGHYFSACPYDKNLANITCYKCSDVRHYANYCHAVKCNNCNKYGHLFNECT